MRFCRFDDGSGPRVGVADGDAVRVAEGVTDLLPLLQNGTLTESLDLGATVDVSTTRLLSPVATPPSFRDFYAFEQHVRAGRASRGLEMDPDWYELPVFYFSNPYAFVGDGDVAMAPGTERWDFELEVAAVLGAGGRDLSPAQAESLIAGYCVLNDWSARDVQRREMRQSLGPAKGKDTATGLGPWFVTPDELADVRTDTGFELTMTATVNGVECSRASWSDVHWSFGDMIAYASRGAEVRAGDVIGSGTCGTGCILELSAADPSVDWLHPGDVVECSIERLGTLRNTVTAPRADPVDLRNGYVPGPASR